MLYCGKCGTQAEDGKRFCSNCGAALEAPVQQEASVSASGIENAFNKFNDTLDETAGLDSSDIENNKLMGVLAYVSWLVLIPMFAAKDSRFARYHVNQGLVLAIAELLFTIIYRAIRFILPYGFLYRMVGLVGNLAYLLFAVISIIGIINAVQGRAKQLPLIGGYKIIK